MTYWHQRIIAGSCLFIWVAVYQGQSAHTQRNGRKRRGETKSLTSLRLLEEIYIEAGEDGCYTGLKDMLYMREQETDFKGTKDVHQFGNLQLMTVFVFTVSLRIYSDI